MLKYGGNQLIQKYTTILEKSYAEIEVKKSKFIANIKAVYSEEEALGFLEEIRKKHYNARHNCFAFQIGEKNEIQRCSDDGEPSGTAGKPILEVLKGNELKNIIVVVTRYFGGTLLGTGGLVRAYSEATKEGINNSNLIEKILYKSVNVTVDYTLSGKVQYEILNGGYILEDTVYTDNVSYLALVEVDQLDNFKNKITEVTSGKNVIEDSNLVYGAYVDSKLKLFDK